MTTLLFLSLFAQAAPTFVETPNTVIGASRQITFTGPRSGEGYFSQDGKKMIFQSEREPGNPFYQMFLLELESGKTTRLSPGQGKTTCGWIHPSGKKVMWSSTHLDEKLKEKTKQEFETRQSPVKSRYSWSYDETFDIFESDLQGKNIKRLTREKGYDAEGSYSPDGKWIAFASNRLASSEKMSEEDQKIFAKDPSYLMEIYLMKADGTQVKRLTDSKGYDGGPFFSADGKKITWRRFNPEGTLAEIYAMNADGTDQKPVTRLGSMSWAPFYHPSGDYIVFTSSVLGYSNFELFIVDSEGKQSPVRVTFDEGFDGLATFTPNGRQISWTHRNEKGESQIYLADWDDSQARRLLNLPSRSPRLAEFSPEIRQGDARTLVEWIAAPEMGGRPAGGSEETILNDFYVTLFRSWGLTGGAPGGGFLHEFEFTSAVKLGEKNSLQFLGGFEKQFSAGAQAEPYSLSASVEIPASPVVFAGYGIKAPATDKIPAYDSYQGLDVHGKWVMVLKDIPEETTPEKRQHLNMYSRVQHKVTVAREAGAKGLLVIDGLNDLKTPPGRALRFEGALSSGSLPVWRVGGSWIKDLLAKSNSEKASNTFEALKKKLDQGEMISFALNSIYVKSQTELIAEKQKAHNVIARLPGRNPKAKAVLIGAHGDHLGRGLSGSSLAKGEEQGRIHLGADDNASGVSAVLELAASFAHEKKLENDLVFAIWSAEEIGVLGSSAFIRDFEKKNGPLSKSFQASLNMDMVGRLRDRLHVQGVGSGDFWSQLSEEVTLKTAVPMALTEDPYLPTDAMSFYLAGLPSISFFTGSHGEYHTPKDQADSLNYPGIERVAKAVAAFAKTLSSSPTPLVRYKKVESKPSQLEGRSFRLYLGTIPDYSQEGVKGVKISGVSKGSPAENAGLKEKDVIVEFAGTKIENIYDYVYTLQSAKPNEETLIRVRRDGREESLKITPKLKE